MAVVACSGKESDEKPANAEEPLEDLDCTDEEGRPEDLEPAPDKDLYHPDVMAMYLERFEFLSEELGTTRVTTCEEAWRFSQLYQEHRDEIVEELANDELPEMEVPEMEGSDADAGQADDAVPEPEELESQTEAPEVEELDEEAAASVLQDATGEIPKVANGIDSNYSFAVSIAAGGKCSATVIGPRAILTAAHCVPATGWYQLDIQYQYTQGAAPRSIFSGARWIYLYRHPYYTGPGANDWDVGVGVLWESYSTGFPSWMWTKLYAGDISAGDLHYHVGYGLTGPGTTSGHQHYGYSKVATVKTRMYRNDPWSSSTPRTICPGDSGGPTGCWHGSEFLLYGINSAAWCGAVHNTTKFESVLTRVRYSMDYIEPALANSGIFCSHGTVSGVAVRQCW
jgi:V8-like Glu-specific endopeptidase